MEEGSEETVNFMGIDGVDAVADLLKVTNPPSLPPSSSRPCWSISLERPRLLYLSRLTCLLCPPALALAITSCPFPCLRLQWIEYDILVADFGDSIENDLSGVGSAGFGALAALSSQVYKDITLAAGYGRPEARKEQSERSFKDWVSKVSLSFALLSLADSCFLAHSLVLVLAPALAYHPLSNAPSLGQYVIATGSSALLFGLYETLRQPLTQVALSVFSGGAVACWGSANVDLCNDVYLLDALPSAILQALTG